MTPWTPEQHRTPHAPVAFPETAAGYARSHGLTGSVTDPGSSHHTWAQATTRAYNRHHLTGRSLQYRHDVLVLATDHGIGTVHVHTVPLEASLVQHQLLSLKLL